MTEFDVANFAEGDKVLICTKYARNAHPTHYQLDSIITITPKRQDIKTVGGKVFNRHGKLDTKSDYAMSWTYLMGYDEAIYSTYRLQRKAALLLECLDVYKMSPEQLSNLIELIKDDSLRTVKSK